MADKRQMVIDRLEIMKKAAHEVIALTCDRPDCDCGVCPLYDVDCGVITEAADLDISGV